VVLVESKIRNSFGNWEIWNQMFDFGVRNFNFGDKFVHTKVGIFVAAASFAASRRSDSNAFAFPPFMAL
jgi:hypothetical protein